VRAVCLIDTSIFLELLKIPGKATRHEETVRHLRQRIERGEMLFLPMATLFEAGNHIGQNGDGQQRRQCAQRFVQQVTAALDGVAPYRPISFLQADELRTWIARFPDHAMAGSGLGDLSIRHDWERLCAQNPGRRVYVWTLDAHLAGCDRAPQL
jgi:hypothetical protein